MMAALNKTPLLAAFSGKTSHYRKTQYFAAFSASLATFSIGMILGYSSPASYQIRNKSGGLPVLLGEPVTALPVVPTTYGNDAVVANTDLYNGTLANLTRSNALSQSEDQPEPTPSTAGPNFPSGQTEVQGEDSTTVAGSISRHLNSTQYSEAEESGEIIMTSEQLAWFSSAMTLGAIAGGLLGSLVQNCFGRRGSLMLVGLPAVTGWFLIGFGTEFGPVVAGRVLTGFFVGSATVAAVIYVAEVSTADIRGLLTVFVDLSLSLGKLFVVVLGAFTNWQDLALASTAPVFLLVVCMSFCKESPCFLITKGNYDEARNSLQHFRGPGVDVSVEFENLKSYQIEETKNKFQLSHLRRPTIYKPLIRGLTIAVFVQLSGIDTLTFNLAYIFQQSGSTLSESGCSIVAICFQVIGNAAGILCIETTGRKKLLVASSIGMAISHACLGGFFFALQVKEGWTAQNIYWMPLLAVILFMLSFSIGFGPVPLVLTGEMFPPSVRETAAGLVEATIFATAFLVIFSFDNMQAALTLGGFYWTYAIFCVLAGAFSALFIKETKGKTLAEVSAMFGGGSSNYIALEPTQGAKVVEDVNFDHQADVAEDDVTSRPNGDITTGGRVNDTNS